MSCSKETPGVWTPDDDEPVVLVGLRPRAEVRLFAQPVDTRPRPEVHEERMVPQLGGPEWLGVEPLGRAGERGHVHTFGEGPSDKATGCSAATGSVGTSDQGPACDPGSLTL